MIACERAAKSGSLRWLDTAADRGHAWTAGSTQKEISMNKVFLTGRLTRDPELRSLASGKAVTQFSLATNHYAGGKERTEYHNVVTWD